jgi:hypothetical protein
VRAADAEEKRTNGGVPEQAVQGSPPLAGLPDNEGICDPALETRRACGSGCRVRSKWWAEY